MFNMNKNTDISNIYILKAGNIISAIIDITAIMIENIAILNSLEGHSKPLSYNHFCATIL